MRDNQVLEGQSVRYFERGRDATKSAIGSNDGKNGILAFVDTVHQNGSLDLTILSPQGVVQKTAVPEANWEPTEFTQQLSKSLQNA
jgi:hypothetical protein